MHYKNHFPNGAVGIEETRFQVHKAIQLISALSRKYLPHDEEDENANLGWDWDQNALITRAFGSNMDIKAGFNFNSQEIFINFNNDHDKHAWQIHGRSFLELKKTISGILPSLNLDPSKYTLKLPYELPQIIASDDFIFDTKDLDSFKELGKYFGNANVMIIDLLDKIESKVDIRCWPHHFDIAALVEIKSPTSEFKFPFVGIGMSPGDDLIRDPYYYITPWQHPDKIDFPSLPKGAYWQKEEWIGAVLKASAISETTNQESLIHTYLLKGFQFAKELVLSV